jgi:hypothetical protein
MIFKSAVDTWYYALTVSQMVLLPVVFFLIIPYTGIIGLLIMLFAVALGAGLPLWCLFTTDYTVTEQHLLVRCGPFRKTIDRSQIIGITPSRSILSAPALSLNRLALHYGAGHQVLISPADPEGFCQALDLKMIS